MEPDLTVNFPTVWYLGIFVRVFAESVLWVDFFLHVFSLLFKAGFIATQNIFNIGFLTIGCFVVALAAKSVDSVFGYKVNRRLFFRPHTVLFRNNALLRTDRIFIVYSVIGGFLWAVGLTQKEYILRSSIFNVYCYPPSIIVLAMVFFLLHQAVYILHNSDKRRERP